MFCCADIQTTNKRRGMQQDLRCSIPSQLHCVNKTKQHTSGQGSQWSRGRLRTWSGTPPSVGWAMSAKVYCLASTFDSTLPKLGRVTTRSEGLKGIVSGPMLVQHSISDSSSISLVEIPGNSRASRSPQPFLSLMPKSRYIAKHGLAHKHI